MGAARKRRLALIKGIESFDQYRTAQEPTPLVTLAQPADVPPVREDTILG